MVDQSIQIDGRRKITVEAFRSLVNTSNSRSVLVYKGKACIEVVRPGSHFTVPYPQTVSLKAGKTWKTDSVKCTVNVICEDP